MFLRHPWKNLSFGNQWKRLNSIKKNFLILCWVANKLAQAWVRLDTPLRELQTFGKSFTEKGSILGKKSTFKNLSLSIHKNKSPCCIQTRDLRVYKQRYTSSFGIINSFKMGWNRHFVSYCHKKVKVMGCWVPLIRMQKVRSFQYHVYSTTYTTTEDKHLIIGFFIVLDRFGILNLIKGLDNFRLRISKKQMERCQVAFWSFHACRSAFFPEGMKT